jgi:ABC-type lipoprotein release transport system permease subunit
MPRANTPSRYRTLGLWSSASFFAIATAAVLRSILFGVSFADPITLAGVGIVLAAVCFLATLLPALRAASTDPIEALRSE